MNIENNQQRAVLECKRLTKVYRRHWAGRSKAVCALQDVSLSIDEGRTVGLIGPNGAGKTTLLKLMAGLIFPNQGCVTVCGHPARSLGARRNLGYAPDSPAFLGRYSARAVLRYHGALSDLSRRVIDENADRLLHQLHLEDAADRACKGFSHGMKKRLAIGITLMNNPTVLLLDEPGDGLDPIGTVDLRNVLKQLKNSGTTILISSHSLGELDKLTSDYIFLDHGQVVPFSAKSALSQGVLLQIGVISGGTAIAEQLQPQRKVIDASDTEVVVAVGGAQDVPDIVCDMAKGGARIVSVTLERENIEDIFVRMYNERNA